MRAFSINRVAVLLWLGAVSAEALVLVFGPHPSEKHQDPEFSLLMLFLCCILCVASVGKMYSVRRNFDLVVILLVGLVLWVMTVNLTRVIGHYVFGWGS
jgi:hypothetical protein